MANSIFFPQKSGMTLGGNLLFSNETFSIGNAASNRPLNVRVATNGTITVGSGANSANIVTSGGAKIQVTGTNNGSLGWISGSRMLGANNGIITLCNQALDGFTRLNIGPANANFCGFGPHPTNPDTSGPRLVLTNGSGSFAGRLGVGSATLNPSVFISERVDNGSLKQHVHIFKTNYTKFVAAGLTSEIDITTTLAKWKIISVIADTTIPYAGLAGTITLMFGFGATPNELILEHDVKTAAITKGLADGDLGTGLARATSVQGGVIPSWTDITFLNARITSGVGNVGAAGITNMTAGETVFYITCESLVTT